VGAGAFFDDWRIRYPLAIFAVLGTLANLYALWYARRVRARFLAHAHASSLAITARGHCLLTRPWAKS
jgi:hypothetical protein